MDQEKKVWGIHTMNDSLFLDNQSPIIGIGWKEMNDLNLLSPNREAIKKQYATTYRDASKGSISTSAGMLYRFAYEVEKEDYIIYPSKSNRMVNIGKITSNYFFDANEEQYPHKELSNG